MLQWTLGYMCLFDLWFSQGINPVVWSLGFIAGFLSGSFIPSLLRTLHTVLPRGCTSLHVNWQCERVPFLHIFSSIFACGFFCFCFFLIMAILIGVSWYLIVVVIFFSLIISYIDHLFMYLLAIFLYIFFGEEDIFFRYSAQCVIGQFLFLYYWTVWAACVFWD